MEDFVTWVDSSKIKQHVMNYNDEVSEILKSAYIYSIILVVEGKIHN